MGRAVRSACKRKKYGHDEQADEDHRQYITLFHDCLDSQIHFVAYFLP